jgi:ABC-type lipoprotein export system ATPase subunit
MIRGKPGSGKSTAMKRAYKLARESSPANESVIAFFFNSRGVSMETKLDSAGILSQPPW